MLILKKMVSTVETTQIRCSGRAQSPSVKEWAEYGEDFFIDNPSLGLKIICDGVGGARTAASARLSEYVAKFFENRINTLINFNASIKQDLLKNVFDTLLQHLIDEKPFTGGSTTLTVTVKSGNTLYGLAVGDSPVKVFRNTAGSLNNVYTSPGTFSLDYTQNQPRPGQIAGPGKYIGKPEDLEVREPSPALFVVDLKPGDIILQTSDGISDNISDEEISRILTPSSPSAMLNEGQVKSEIIGKLTEKYAQGPSRQRPDSPWIESQIVWAKDQLRSIQHTFRYVDMDHANGNSPYIRQFFNQFEARNVHPSHKAKMRRLKNFFDQKFNGFLRSSSNANYRNDLSAMKGVLSGFMSSPGYSDELSGMGLKEEYKYLHHCLHQKKDELTFDMFLRSDRYPNSGKQVFRNIARVLCPQKNASEKSTFIGRFLGGDLDGRIKVEWTREGSSTPTMKQDDATVIVELHKPLLDGSLKPRRRTSSSDPDDSGFTESSSGRSSSGSDDDNIPLRFIGPSVVEGSGIVSPKPSSPKKEVISNGDEGNPKAKVRRLSLSSSDA